MIDVDLSEKTIRLIPVDDRIKNTQTKEGCAEILNRKGIKELLAFLHFPPIFKGYICDEIILELYRKGVERCYFGHIHGFSEFPREFVFEDISFSLISS